MLTLYRALGAILFHLLPHLAKLSSRVRSVWAPRQGLLERWRKAPIQAGSIWFHISSVGELEQVRPVIEKLRGKHPVFLSYFSNSVPRLVKDWSFVDYADFLPLDFEGEMEELVAILKPKMMVLDRYDLWPNHLAALKRFGAKVVVVNASTPPFTFWGKVGLYLRRSLFESIDAWTFVDAAAAYRWEPYLKNYAPGSVLGDPRVDRSLARVKGSKSTLPDFKSQLEGFCLVAGSTWPEDEELLLKAWKDLSIKRTLILVPHEPDSKRLEEIEKLTHTLGFSSARLSQLSHQKVEVILVDQRGLLAELYAWGQMAYVGGGFGRHIHSIIEPIAHGKPVAFGPHHRRSPEAVALATTDAALALSNKSEIALRDWISQLANDKFFYEKAQEPIRIFLQIHQGAADRVAEFLETLKGKS